jgi:hypothetical protein
MSTKMHRQPWDDKQDMFLHRAVGLQPLDKVAKELGRTPDAVRQRMKQLRVVLPSEQPEYLTPQEFATAMGLNRITARHLLKQSPFGHEAFYRNRRVRMAVRAELRRWLANPLNWLNLDETKITDLELRQVVEQAKADSVRDRWFTLAEAAEFSHYSYHGINKWIYRDKILPTTRGSRGRKGISLHLIKKSDLERVLRERGA